MFQVDSTGLYLARTPDNQEIQIPASIQPEQDFYNALNPEQQKQYYDDNGYLVVRNLFPDELCDQIDHSFKKQVKSHQGYIYRQTSSFPEKHQLSESGYILNSIKHIQDMRMDVFDEFIQNSFQAIAHLHIRNLVQMLVGEDTNIVQTMFFEGNPATPPHHDSYYLDSAEIGKMVAVWIALEDIHPGAGRFFVYPGSHKLALPRNAGEYEMSFNHKNYLQEIRRIIAEPGMECRAPMLKKGDVLFWNACTIHGSLNTTEPTRSRKSLTAHFIPKSQDYLLFQKVKQELNLKIFNGMPVHCPKDPDKIVNRLQMFGLRWFPKSTDFIRKCIIHLSMK